MNTEECWRGWQGSWRIDSRVLEGWNSGLELSGRPVFQWVPGFVCKTNITIWPQLKVAQYCCYDWLITQKQDQVAHKHYMCRFLCWHTWQPTWLSSWSSPRSQGQGSDPQGSFLIKADRRLAIWDQKTCTEPESKCRPLPILTELFLTLLDLVFTVLLIPLVAS